MPHRLVSKGLELLINKCSEISSLIHSDSIGTKYKGKYMATDYILKGETHTMGNMIQEFIYNQEFSENPKGKQLTHVSYHEPHPLENEIILRLVLKDVDNNDSSDADFESYKSQTSQILLAYLDMLRDHLTDCYNQWNQLKHPSASTLL